MKDSNSRLDGQSILKVADNILVAFYTCRLMPDGKPCFSFLSQGVKSLFGLTPEDACSDYQRLWDMVLPEDQDLFCQMMKTSYEKMTPLCYDLRIKTAGGVNKWIHGESIPERCAPDGDIVWNGAMVDTTVRKQMEESLRESEKGFRSLFENARDGIILADLKTKRFFMANNMICQMLGYTREEMTSLGVEDIHPENELPLVQQRFDEMARGEVVLIKDMPVKRKSGNVFYADISASAMIVGNKKYIMGSFRDVTERRKAEEDVKGSRDYLNKIINTIADPVFVKDRQHKWVLLNDAYCQFMGYSREELIGKSDYDYFPPSEVDVFWSKDEMVFKTGKENINEEKFTGANGITHVIVTKKTLYRDTSGRDLIVGVIRDITDLRRVEEELRRHQENLEELITVRTAALEKEIGERKKIEEVLLDSEARYRVLAENIPLILLRCGPDGKLLVWNKYAEDLLGYNKLEVIGRMRPEDLYWDKAKFEKIERMALSNGIYDDEMFFLHKDGRLVQMRVVLASQRELEGRVIALPVFAEDVTDRRKMELALRESKELMQLQINRMPIAFIMWDQEFKAVSWNPAAEKTFGFTAEEAIGKRAYETIVPETVKERIGEIWQRMLDGDITANSLNQNITKDGRTIICEWNNTPLKKKDGTVIGVLSMVQDISDRVHAEEELKRAMAIKSEFISVVSHELRTPLGSLKEAVSIIMDGLVGSINDEQRDLLTMANRNVDRLKRLINNVLDFQKLVSRGMPFDMGENSIEETAREVYDTMRLVARNKGLEFTIKIDPGIPRIKYDYDKIVEVVQNFVTNALKYTSHGNVQIRVAKEAAGVHVIVSDTGYGIKSEDLPRLFESFQQLEVPKGIKKEGTGLGLAICKEIITAHNGKIWAESEFGKGSSFHFVLPFDAGVGAVDA